MRLSLGRGGPSLKKDQILFKDVHERVDRRVDYPIINGSDTHPFQEDSFRPGGVSLSRPSEVHMETER